MNITEMIDRRWALEQEINALQKEMDGLSNEIATMMIANGLKEITDSNGLRYSTGSSTRYDYKKPVYDYLEEKGLLGYFAQEPKVTKSKLQILLDDGVLSYADMSKIEAWTIVEQGAIGLRKKARKEASNVA